MLLLTDDALVAHFKQTGEKFPFSATSLRRDRAKATLGGIPFHPIGGKKLYNPAEVSAFVANIPPCRAKAPVVIQSVHKIKLGAPTKLERIRAQEMGITVKQLREMEV